MASTESASGGQASFAHCSNSVSVSAMHEVADALASAEVTLLDDANGHGWDMLNGPGGPSGQTVADQLTAFILG